MRKKSLALPPKRTKYMWQIDTDVMAWWAQFSPRFYNELNAQLVPASSINVVNKCSTIQYFAHRDIIMHKHSEAQKRVNAAWCQ